MLGFQSQMSQMAKIRHQIDWEILNQFGLLPQQQHKLAMRRGVEEKFNGKKYIFFIFVNLRHQFHRVPKAQNQFQCQRALPKV